MTDQAMDSVRTEIAQIIEALETGKYKRVRKRLRHMHPAKIASLIETLDDEQRLAVWQQVDAANEGRILAHLSPALARRLPRESGEPLLEDEAGGVAASEAQRASTQMREVREALAQGKLKRVGKILNGMHPAKVAGLLEALPPEERSDAWSMVETERAGKVLSYLHDESCASLAQEMDPEDLVVAARRLDLDDLVDLIQTLPEDSGRQLLQATDARHREKLESMLSYPEDSAGGLMNTDHIAVRPDVKVQTVLGYLRLLKTLPVQTDKLMVVDRKGIYQGVLLLSTLVTVQPERRVADIMDTETPAIPVDMPDDEVAHLFQDLDLLSAPVVDAQRMLLGRITVDDVVDQIRESSERAMMHMAGLDQEADIFAPVLTSSRRRAVWLGINLLTAFLAAWVIGLFQTTLERVVALAVLMPIVASMGGIAGSQTLTLVIRGMALGQVAGGNARALLSKEMGIAALNGVAWALVVAALAVVWFGDWQIGGVIGAAILINLLFAALAGLAVPLVLDRLGIDPALAGGVILTTVTDVIGFFAFLGLATVVL
ncbi:magnesium transporter [Denitromonas iodatirespirans]|uniref:Magnesium transporter MgtE n=1 Tax=Denitromonas iodatirespirans TaxID=2795389 RepID=A0A944HC66_DENI1|nr:magnesium transporter [Denitromonas iodatirespirans]MBT0962392.1 magnesium transporter [Denitromonas iodatirespirans]